MNKFNQSLKNLILLKYNIFKSKSLTPIYYSILQFVI
jgi:hypothetical protein